MAAVFLHYEQGSAPFTCKIKTELGLDEALEKFRTKYRKKHGREPPPLEAHGHNDATWRALPAKTDVFLTEGKAPERPKPLKPPPAPPTTPPPAATPAAIPAAVGASSPISELVGGTGASGRLTSLHLASSPTTSPCACR